MKWIKDLLYNATNEFPDIGRAIALFCLSCVVVAMGWNMHLQKEISLAELGGALSAILGALVAYIYHDRKQNDASGSDGSQSN